MKAADCTLFLAVLPVALAAAPARVARIGELDGQVEVQLHPFDAWRPAVRNLPLVERAWVRSGPAARVEMELDEGSAVRLTGDAIGELSDYTRLSTGQRVTLFSLDHGVAYFTGEPDRRDSFILAVPGAQVTVRGGTRVRLEASESVSQIAVIEGRVRFSSPAAELDVNEGQTARIENGSRPRFFLRREIVPFDSDRWSEQRDRALAASGSAGHLPDLFFGLVDLDASGAWMQNDELGVVWKPKANSGWTPYRDGQWLWYDELGYTWIANEAWGWLPFHYGRWMQTNVMGWVWVPGKGVMFKPGEVYWLREANVVGWGPLAPGETWSAASLPRQYSRANTTLAHFTQDARMIAPVNPAEKVSTTAAVFVIAPPSPAWDSARFEAVRPVLRAGSTRVVPLLPGVTYEGSEAAPEPPPAPEIPSIPPQPLVAASAADASPAPRPPVAEPPEVYYPVSVYTGIVVVNPPDRAAGTSGSGADPGRRPHLPVPREDPPRPGRPPKVPQWKERAEYDLYGAITKEQEPANRLPLLINWRERYSASDFVQMRNDLFVQTYAALRQPSKVIAAGNEALEANPQDFTAMYLMALNVQLLPKPTVDDLAAGQKAAQAMLANLGDFFAINRKPPNTSDLTWAEARTQAQSLAYATMGWIALQKKDDETAETEFTNVLQIAPNASTARGWPVDSAQVSSWLGTAIAREAIQQKRPERYAEALFQFARAASLGQSQGGLPSAAQTSYETYFVNAFNRYHGQDPAELAKLRELSKSSAFPPRGWTLEGRLN